MKQQINEIERMQQLAGILAEAPPPMPPVPGQKPKLPPVPGQKPAGSTPVGPELKKTLNDWSTDTLAYLEPLVNSNIISKQEHDTLNTIITKVSRATK
jgi:hypothetical protein